MSVSERFLSWSKLHQIDITWQTTNIFAVKGRGENFLLIEDKPVMVDEENNLIFSSTELRLLSSVQYIVFIFGTRYYYCKSNEELTYTIFKNVGKALHQSDIPHIGVHGHYELCNSVGGTYEAVCNKAKFIGINVLGICEKHTLAGAIAFQNACDKAKIKSIIGCTITVRDKESAYLLKAYCKNENGFSNLIYLNNVLKFSDEEEIAEQVVFDNFQDIVFIYDKSNDFNRHRISRLKGRLDIYYQLDLTEIDSPAKDRILLENYALYLQFPIIPPLYICDTYLLEPYQAKIRKKINEIGKGGGQTYSRQAYLKSHQENDELWGPLLENVSNSLKISPLLKQSISNLRALCDQIDWTIQGKLRLPKYKFSVEEARDFSDSEELLWHFIAKGFQEKVQNKVSDEEVYISRIHEELSVIKEGGFVDYFLIIRDLLNWSREQDILVGLGRGSAAGCLISYLIDIVQVDPIEYDLLFERFLNRGRLKKGLPDIDCDIPSSRREEVKHYIENKYGLNYVASIGTYTTFQFKGALKDLSRVYNIPFQAANYISAALFEVDSFTSLVQTASRSHTVKSFLKENVELIEAISDIQYQVKTPSIHAAGIVIVPQIEGMDIMRWLPVKKIDGAIVTEWEGEYLDQLGFLKCDILGIRQLDKFYDIEQLILKHTRDKVTFKSIDLQDRRTFQLFQNGSNEDVFQFGAQGLKSYTKQLKPSDIEDLIATVALYRPGPISTGAHKQYIDLKNGKETPEYHYGIEHLTNKTYSLFIYQEQVIQTVQELGGLTLVEGDDVRKGMGKKDQSLLDKYKQIFLKGAVERGCPQEEAGVIWNKMEVFGTYAFNRSHATCYALTGYYSQWLKANYPIYFWAVSLQYSKEDNLPNRLSEIVRTSTIKLSPIDINKSEATYQADFKNNVIYWSFSSLKFVGEAVVDLIILERVANGLFYSLEDFVDRMSGKKINKRQMISLILSGAFDQVEKITLIEHRQILFTRLEKAWKSVSAEDVSKYIQSPNSTQWYFWQKEYSGYAVLDYKDYWLKKKKNKAVFIEEIPDESYIGQEVNLVGVPSLIEVKNSKRGVFLRLKLTCNFELFDITLWNDVYAKYSSLFAREDIYMSVITLNVKVVYDSYRQSISFHSQKNTIITHDS